MVSCVDSGPQLRPAQTSDVAGISAIVDAAYQPFRDAGLDLPPVSEGLSEDVETRVVWVAELDNKLAGVVILAIDATAHVMNLAVSPDASGQGIGDLLLRHAVQLAGEAGHRTVHLATHVEMLQTQDFYRKRGWQETGRDGQKLFFARET